MKTLLIIFLVAAGFSGYVSSQNEWEEVKIFTGQSPGCINYSNQFDFSIDNFLRVSVGNNTDIVLKIHNNSSGKCIRCVYISAGGDFYISNIPEGYYTLKIAFGKKWSRRNSDLNNCESKFTENAMYEEGENILDFTLKYTNDGYQIPSYELYLDVYTTNQNKGFDSRKISEEEFFR